jgi:hypothetical protein
MNIPRQFPREYLSIGRLIKSSLTLYKTNPGDILIQEVCRMKEIV